MCGNLLLHDGDTIRALDNLGGILTSCNKDCGNNVSSLSVKTIYRSSYSRTDQVLRHVELDQTIHIALKDLLNNVSGDDSLSDSALSSSLDLVNSSGLLIRTIIGRYRDDLHIVKALLGSYNIECVLDTLRHHVYTHSVSRGSVVGFFVSYPVTPVT